MIQIWHNPRCSKSREALKLLEEKGVEVEIFKYLDEELSVDDIKKLLKKIGASPKDIIRTKETIYKELNLKEANEEELIEAMAKHHKLIERPIVIKDNKAILGRPPIKVLEIL
jgi:arsenate reductase